MTASWVLGERMGTAAELHHPATMAADSADRRFLRAGHVTGPALVLGSSQSDEGLASLTVDEGLGSVDVVRRRTGGGAVWVAPGEQAWIDLWMPAEDHLAAELDVVGSATWVGQRCASALAELGVTDLSVHSGPWEPGRWGRLVCFAGRGPGELFREGRKVLGLAQRRARAGRWFQLMVPSVWEPPRWAPLLAAVPAAGGAPGGRGGATGAHGVGGAGGAVDGPGGSERSVGVELVEDLRDMVAPVALDDEQFLRALRQALESS